MSDHSHTTEGHEHGEHAGLDKAKIWKVAGILTLITAIEFIIALWAIPGHHIPQDHSGTMPQGTVADTPPAYNNQQSLQSLCIH